MPPNATARPKNRIVNSSSSRVPTSRETTLPPQRAIVNITMRKRNETASFSTTAQRSVSPLSTTETIAR